jgi:uncharacterized protein with GYD domain
MVLACIMIHCKPGTAPDVMETIKSIKSVRRVFETLGAYDVVVEYEFPSLEKLGITVYEIARINGVIATETLIETIM